MLTEGKHLWILGRLWEFFLKPLTPPTLLDLVERVALLLAVFHNKRPV